MIDLMLKRTSIRSFKDKKLDIKTIEQLKQVVNASPTWKNYQDFSAIFITDQNTKDKLSVYNLNQNHIKTAPLIVVFNADLNFINLIIKNKNLEVDVNKIHNYLISFTDAVIAANNLMNAAISLGLGTCYLGVIRTNADKVIDLLNIKGKCIPTIAVAIGYIDKPSIKTPKHNKVYDEKYDISLIQSELCVYDQEMSKFYINNLKVNKNYSDVIAKTLAHERADNMLDLINKYFYKK